MIPQMITYLFNDSLNSFLLTVTSVLEIYFMRKTRNDLLTLIGVRVTTNQTGTYTTQTGTYTTRLRPSPTSIA